MSSNYRDLMSPQASSDVPLDALLPRRKIVVVVGIDDYRGLPKLRCAVSDALGVQALLVRQFGFEAPIAPLTNQAATKQAIEALVEDHLRKLLQPDDALILFFAGHGTTRLARLDALTVETGYIAPVEARGPDVFSDLIDMGELLRKIGMLPARHILVVLDACHSGMALGTAVSQYRSIDSFVHRLAANPSRRVITSARRAEVALDSGPVPGHSLFTGAFIQALATGQADMDGNGIITFSELALCVQQWVGQASGSRQTPDYGAFHLDNRGELVLAANSQGLQALRVMAPPAPPRAVKRSRPFARLAFIAGLPFVLTLFIVYGVTCSSIETLRCLTASGCYELAGAYDNGTGVPKDPAHAVELYGRTCDAGKLPACARLAAHYSNGIGVAKDDARAAELSRKACDGGDAGGCANLGVAYEFGLKDDARAAGLYRKACDRGNAVGCAGLGAFHMDGRGGVSKDDERAFELSRKACLDGEPRGCGNLGVLYRDGRSVPKDDVRAAELFRKVCDMDGGVWCVRLGEMYNFGRGVRSDLALAAGLFQKACDEGEPQGCGWLGLAYQNGRGVQADPARARGFYERACNGGDMAACNNLGVCYEKGIGGPVSLPSAVDLYGKACEAGYSIGCTNLNRFPKRSPSKK